jgi:hypothetical protein
MSSAWGGTSLSLRSVVLTLLAKVVAKAIRYRPLKASSTRRGGAKAGALSASKEATTKRKPLSLRQRAASVLLRNILRHCRPSSGDVPQVERDAAISL